MVCCKICLSLDQLNTNCVICSAGHIKQERELYISLLFTSEINFRELPSKSLCIEVSLLRGILVLIIHLCQLSLFFQYYVVYYRYKILLVFFGHFICLCFSCLTKCLLIVTVFPPPLLSCQLQKRKRREYSKVSNHMKMFFLIHFLFPYAAEIVSADLHQYLTGMDMIHLRELVAVH